MKTKTLVVASAAALLSLLSAEGQGLTLANPHWNITLTDHGYSDFLLDNTPGFEGREYLSGEWGAAVGYQVTGGPSVAAEWLQPTFLYPDWPTNSTFTVVTPLTETGVNADNLPVAFSVIENTHLRITQNFEMIDTVTGTPMGTKPATEAGAGSFNHSNRYVMKQTYTVTNITGAAISNIQLFQLLHGLNSQRGLFDNHTYSGPLGDFHYDTTLAGVDAWAAGAGAGLEDFISFHATSAPTAHEIGYFGIEGNGVDNHGVGKPTDGVHLSIEANWQTAPYNTRQGTDFFQPPTRWVAGAQRWTLGNLAPNQSVGFGLLLSILTGTKVPAGPGSTGSCDGGSSVPGGIDYEFESVETEGTCFSDFSRADEDEVATRIAEGDFSAFTFQTPSQPAQLWKVEFSGTYSGAVHVNFGYDATLLPPGFAAEGLAIYHYTGGTWVKLPGVVNPATNIISVSTPELGVFALGTDALTTFDVAAGPAPANSGIITGAGTYAEGSSVTLAAAPNASYIFTNWTEGAAVISTSPTYTFLLQADRTFVANFATVGTGKIITTSSTPTAGGSTSGDGEYALGASATVSATPNPGYKFSKWLVDETIVSNSANYTFTVAGNRTLVAKFKPVYYVTATAQPLEGGNPEADPLYEVGELAKLKSKPEPGWSLVNWTENGVVVSTDVDFSFTVNGNRNLVANYALGDRIDLVAEPKTAGDVGGAGVYQIGAEVTVTASARPGYIFLKWTEADNYVSSDASYTFNSSAPRALTARFAALPKIDASPALTPGQLIFTWPDTPDWVLLESPDLTTWTPSTRTVTTTGGQNSISVETSEGRTFFRLAHP
jgi:hypothetical protein